MNWFNFSGRQKQRQQRQESLSRLSQSRMQQLDRASVDHANAAASVTAAVQEQRGQSVALRSVLNTVVRRLRARQERGLKRGTT